MSTIISELKAVFTADTSDFDAGLGRVDTGLGNTARSMGRSLSNMGSSIRGIGTSMVGAAAPFIAGFGLMANAALGFGSQMTNIQAVTGMTDEQIAGLGDTLLDVDSTFSNLELAGTFYDIAGSVTDASQRMPIFEEAIATAEAGQADLQATTAVLTSTLNAYGSEAITAAHASDVMTRTVGMGVGTMNDFAAALPGVTGLAASLGVSFDEIAASAAFLTTKGNTPAEAVTQLSAAMVSLLNPNETMKEALRELGFASGDALIEMYGLTGALNMVSDTSVVAEEGLAKTLGSVEALRGATALTADTTEDLQVKMGNFEINLPINDFQAFNAQFREGVDNATAMAQAVQLGDTAAQVKLVTAEFDDLKVIIGEALLPAIFDVTQEVKPMLKSFASFAKANPKLIRTVAVLALGLAGLGTAFIVLGSILSAAGTVFGLVGGALAFLLSPVGLVVAGVIALGAAFAFLSANNIFGLGDALGSLGAGLRDILGLLVGFGEGLLNAFQSGGISAAVGYFKDQFIGVLAQIGAKALATGAEIATNIGNGLATGIPKIVETAKQYAPLAAGSFADAMVTQGPTIQRGAGEFAAAIDREAPKVATRGGFLAGLLTGDFLIAMITYGPQIIGAMAVVGYHIGAGILKIGADLVGWGFDIAGIFVASFALGLIVKLPGIWAALEGQFNTLVGDPVKKWFDQMAQDAAEGWKTGFGLKALPDWLKGQFDLMVQKVKDFLGIRSPSTLFADMGKNVAEGFVNGVNSMLGALTGAARAMYQAVSGPLTAMIDLANRAASAVGSSSMIGSAVSATVGSPIVPTVVGGVPGSNPLAPGGGLALPQAFGGQVMRNHPYIVGDAGRPELFVPGTDGKIIPNLNDLSRAPSTLTPSNRGGGDTYISGTFIINGVQDAEGMYKELDRINRARSKPAFVRG